jgi:hypothetical protein
VSHFGFLYQDQYPQNCKYTASKSGGACLWYVPQQVDPEGGVQGGDEGLDHQRQVQALHREYELVKGLGYKINIFFKHIKFNQYFLYMRQWGFNFLPVLLKSKINIKALLASLQKKLFHFKDCSETCIKFLFRLSFSLIG